jgi:predicted TIM-barrel fold metal-dependent hydrolase
MSRLTRRSVLRLAGGGFASFAGSPGARSLQNTALDFAVPRGACDCHVHVIGDADRFPMAPLRTYTPPLASPEDLIASLRMLRLERVVIVQPTFYGTDNSAMLDGIQKVGPRRARGVAVIDNATTSSDLNKMRNAGVRGIRVNLETIGVVDPEIARVTLKTAIEQARQQGWHIQLYTRLSIISALVKDMEDCPVPIVFDHFAGAQAALGPMQPGFETVLRLVSSARAYVKISGAYRASRSLPPYSDVEPLAKALVAANPDRILWGSDWPHTDATHIQGRAATDITPFLPIDDALVFDQLPHWVPDPAIRRKILMDNPTRLYGF